MQRFLFTVCGIWALSAGIVVVAMIAGGRLHPDWTPYFDHIDLCDGKLCAFGILPGVTSWTDTKTFLSKIPASFSLEEVGTFAKLDGEVDRTLFTLYGQVLNQKGQLAPAEFMSLSLSSRLTVGALVARFGVPCSVHSNPRPPVPGFIMYYPFGWASIRFSDTNYIIDTTGLEVSENEPINLESWDRTYFFSGKQTCGEIQRDSSGLQPWRGFRSLRFYPRNN